VAQLHDRYDDDDDDDDDDNFCISVEWIQCENKHNVKLQKPNA